MVTLLPALFGFGAGSDFPDAALASAFGSVGVFCEGVFFGGDAPITIPMLMPVAKSSDLEGLIPRVR